MKIKSLLDRYEILFPDNSHISDLRRAVVDHDMSSIFRLCRNEELRKAIMEENLHSIFRIIDNYDTEDLRKAVIEKNLYSIFRLLDDSNQIKKIVLNENIYATFDYLSTVTDSAFTQPLKKLTTEDYKWNHDCFSRGQIESKRWLVDQVSQHCKYIGTVFLCAGWYATLATMLFESKLEIEKIRSFDIDDSCREIAEIFNKQWLKDNWRFKATTQDIMEIDFSEHNYQTPKGDGTSVDLYELPDTIINTSFEHIKNYSQWWSCIPSGKLVIIQCNNYNELQEHVSCAKSLEHFGEMTPIKNLLYEGELKFEKYTRYMRIGYK